MRVAISAEEQVLQVISHSVGDAAKSITEFLQLALGCTFSRLVEGLPLCWSLRRPRSVPGLRALGQTDLCHPNEALWLAGYLCSGSSGSASCVL